MFKLFGKKQKSQEEPSDLHPSRHPKAAALAAQFGTEEFDILAVTGANAFGGVETGADEEYRTVSLPLTAWREGDGPIHREDTCLLALADDKLLGYLRRLAQPDSIIQARVRQSAEGDRFLLVGLPGPVMDSELKAILAEQTQPVSVWVPDLGTFVLNRSVNWFQTETDWLGQSIQLVYDQSSEVEMQDSRQTAVSLMSAQNEWDERIRSYAADELLSLANQWAQDGAEEGDEPPELDKDEFMARMELESVQAGPNGSFEFWFQDGDLFWGHSIHVTGSLSQGPVFAQMEG